MYNKERRCPVAVVGTDGLTHARAPGQLGFHKQGFWKQGFSRDLKNV